MELHKHSQPLISIITVVFNAADTIEQTILSVINQSYINIEYIIIDGGSLDGTVEIIKKYQDKIKHWRSEKDDGIYDAMNKGVGISNGDYIYFLGSDDILTIGFSEFCELLHDESDIYYGNVIFKSRNKKYDGHFSSFKLATRNICHQGIFYPKVVFKNYRFDLRYKLHADYVLNMQCYGDDRFNFRYINKVIAVYNDAGNSAVAPLETEFLRDKLMYVKMNFNIVVYIYVLLRKAFKKAFKPLWAE